MRLLYFSNGELELTEDLLNDGDIPPYAILSHTWGKEEVLFEEMTNKQGKTKAGYDKILFCAQQAAEHGLQYCWVDSCCIDKSNNPELTEAINSMFRWYQNAERCYVFLSDVSTCTDEHLAERSKRNPDDTVEAVQEWVPAFRNSRWFTRGWTLQELIAPRNVEFYTMEKECIGTKQSLEKELHEVTSIPRLALCNHPLANFSIEERFSWTTSRQTTYEEDMAYCLLGVFGINMPLLYGEGRDSAMRRLHKMAEHAREGPSGTQQQQKLSGLRQWLGVPDPSIVPQRAIKKRSQNTTVWILENAEYIAWKTKPASFLWLSGRPGSGKTVISTAILEDLLQHCVHRNVGGVCAHFYFEFDKDDTERMLRSLLCQLTKYCTQMSESLDKLFALRDHDSQPSVSSLLHVLYQVIIDFPTVFILLEGLDECVGFSELIDVLGTVHEWQLPNLHLVLLSRPLPSIESSCSSHVDNCFFLDLGQSQEHFPQHDIQQYIQERLSHDENFSKWADDAEVLEHIQRVLIESSGVSFLFATLQLDFLASCTTKKALHRTLAKIQ